MRTFSSYHLTCLCVCAGILFSSLLQGWGFSARVDDVVSPRVVSVQVTDGELTVDREYKVMRDGKEVARIQVRTATGICKVLSGDPKKGDLLVEVEDVPDVVVATTNQVSSRDYSLSWTNALPDVIHTLLRAEGTLDAAVRLAEHLPPARLAALNESLERARENMARIYPACRVYRTESDRERISLALREAAYYELAENLSPVGRTTNQWFGTLYPVEAQKLPGYIPDRYGVAEVITPDPTAWVMPVQWGRPSQPPQFSGWSFEGNTAWVTNGAMPLARRDVSMDDGILRGEINLQSGDSIYIALRTDVVVKFHIPGRGDRGAVSYKVGFNNLRFSSGQESVENIQAGSWLPFSIRLEREKLHVHLNGESVLETTITKDERFKGTGLASFGHVALGSLRGAGGFRNLELEGLSPRTRRSFSRFIEMNDYEADGPEIDMLSNPAHFMSLVHNMTEGWKTKQHLVESDLLMIRGAPYAQFAVKGSDSDHFKVSGQIRFNEAGSAWFRAHSKLMFGVVVDPDSASAGDSKPVRMKTTTGNFHQADELFDGNKLKTGKWYTWSLEFHDPAAVFTINDQTFKASGPADRDKETTGPSQFGVSSYNTEVDLKDLRFQKMKPADHGFSNQALEALITRGEALLAQAMEMLQKEATYGAGIAAAILDGSRPPRLALDDEFAEVARTFREQNDWTTYLALLEANMRRLEGDAAKNAKLIYTKAREKFQVALEMTETGEIGLDKVLRTGDAPGVLISGPNGMHVLIQETSELLSYSVKDQKIAQRMTLDVKLDGLLDRGSYYLGAVNGKEDGATQLVKLSVEDGTVLKTLPVKSGRITDIAPHPQQAVTYVCVNENPNESSFEFAACKVYRLDEERFELHDTPAVGMVAKVDPYGRFLYTAFQLKLTSSMNVDPGTLQVVPAPVVDHVISYTLDGDTLEMLAEQPMPGVNGTMMDVDPEGRYFCYVPTSGFPQGLRRSIRKLGIPAWRAGQVDRVLGMFEPGTSPQAMTFNPCRPEAYAYAGQDIRRFDRRTFSELGVIDLPPHLKDVQVSKMMTSPDGMNLFMAFSSDEVKGVYIQPLDDDASDVSGQDMMLNASAKEILAAAKTLDDKQAKALLQSAWTSRAFTDEGELLAAALLEMEGHPYRGVISNPFRVPETTAVERKQPTKPDDVKLDGSRAKVLAPDQEDEELMTALDDLGAFDQQAERWPESWLWRCREAELVHSNSVAIRYRAAEQLVKMSDPESARALCGDILKQSELEGYYAFKSWLLLADISSAAGKPLSALTALDQAARLYPGNPVLHNRLAELYEGINMPNNASWHLLHSWALFPSQPGLVDQLSAYGVNVKPENKELTTTELFQMTSPSIVLIKHESGSGTGYIIGNGGLLLTNWHVIEGAEKDPIVRFMGADGEKEHDMPAKVLATDSRKDIALLAIELGDAKVTPLLLGDSEKLKTGDPIVAIGNPGFGASVLTQTATEGIVSNADRKLGLQSYIQISAAVNPGNSGGPLLNRYGQVVGMVTLKAQLENVGFAVPANDLIEFVLKQHQ